MSGARRRSKYRKHVTNKIEDSLPEPSGNEKIVRVVGSRGGNIFEIMLPSGRNTLCLLPTKFRNLVWIRRNSFLIVSSADGDFLNAAGDKGKVQFMIEHILLTPHVKHLRKTEHWPASFAEEGDASSSSSSTSTTADSEVDALSFGLSYVRLEETLEHTGFAGGRSIIRGATASSSSTARQARPPVLPPQERTSRTLALALAAQQEEEDEESDDSLAGEFENPNRAGQNNAGTSSSEEPSSSDEEE